MIRRKNTRCNSRMTFTLHYLHNCNIELGVTTYDSIIRTTSGSE
ncbi:hypothetical protein Lser_V15G16628 [Lactuca serriola]